MQFTDWIADARNIVFLVIALAMIGAWWWSSPVATSSTPR
jgi:hypothetical protein